MPEILTPRFELLGRLTRHLSEADERHPQAVRVEVRQAVRLERFTEDRPDRRGAAPMRAFQAGNLRFPWEVVKVDALATNSNRRGDSASLFTG